MKKNEVKINGYYSAKVSDKLTVVRIIDENPRGGWEATNTRTGKKVTIKSPARLRAEVTPDGKPIKPKAKAAKPATETPDAAPACLSGRQVEHGGDAATQASTDTTEPAGRDLPAGRHGTWQPGATGTKPRELTVGKVTGAPAGSLSACNAQAGKMSLVDAAIHVMKEVDEPLPAGRHGINTKRMVALVTERDLWQPSRGGKTPHATLYSAILREIRDKGDDSRFEKVERGKFTLKNHS
jgi:hypothetical protein